VSSTPFLFVYGTLLRASRRNRYSRYLGLHAGFAGRALLPGRLYGLKRYPCMRPPQSDDDWVAGEVFRLRSPHDALAVLDDYEGRQYRRVVRWATLEGGRAIRCWVYEFAHPVPRHRWIASGAWENPRCF
jgi:gamma-glutamylcyclotransferase (GGCT)/AIG2-like uncharacterized protein YtfP